MAALNHPHICTLFDVGPSYLVMKFIAGRPLRGPLPEEQAVAYALQILDALEAAHQQGIVHRDLKPANILITDKGIKLLDFGLAKLNREPAQPDETQTLGLTQAGAAMGTPAYMAPEQWEGKPADARSDIYAFGGVLYELLTGQRAGRERVPLRSARLEAIVAKCLANDPAARWQSAGEVRASLMKAAAVRSPASKRIAIAAAAAVAIAAVVLWNKQAPARRSPIKTFWFSPTSRMRREIPFSTARSARLPPSSWNNRLS